MDELDRLLVERSCERLIMEYSRLVDFGEAAAVADLFTEDARWEGTDLVLSGREEIRAWFVKREGIARRVSRHVFTNVMVDVVSPTEATSVSYMINYRHDRQEGDETLPVVMEVPKWVGEARDSFRLTDDGWRFASRLVEPAFVRRRQR
ncbi:MAG TPA: nuclear transport factor 2 family protein [Solirubrobacterales bacterium]|nr:nuclear transport factor 2 family protein [Solirubrobacterales bacterium]